MDNATIYFSKITNRELYRYVNILEFVDDRYVITNKISDHNLHEMRMNMDESDVESFDSFVERMWGVKNKSLDNNPRLVSAKVGAGKPLATTVDAPKKGRGRPKKV